jgi:hypothetical protein
MEGNLGRVDVRQLKWSRNSAGSLDGKVGHVKLFVIAFYAERGYFLAPKLPGLNKTIPVNSEEDGKVKAEVLYQRYLNFLKGAEWYQEPIGNKSQSGFSGKGSSSF